MQAQNPRPGHKNERPRIYDRILGDVEGERNEALVFAVSSIFREICDARHDGTAVVREVATDSGLYSICGTLVYTNDVPHPVVVVHARPAGASASPEVQLCQRYHLTRKEARVAVLLAEQKSNEEIARQLFISSHTARHHTQSVMSKLGIRSRREVAARIGSD